MPKPPSSAHRTPTSAKDRVDALADPDAVTETLSTVDTSRPLAARDAKPGEHGHVDGPRGLQDFHAHDGGDAPHGHKRGALLDRTAALDEWIPPLAASAPNGAAPTADPTPASVVEASGDAPAAAGSDRPTTSLIRPDQTLEIRLAEAKHKLEARLTEVEILAALQDLSRAGANQLDLGDLVGAEVIRQVKDTVDRWAHARGILP